LIKDKKKVLIIAPHPDDEINLAGQFSVTLKKLGYTLFTLYITNGDYTKKIGNKRLYEAINANRVLGISNKNVVFLGYANEWKENKHIYNMKSDEVAISKLGKTKTNSIPEHPEYCYKRYGIHHEFTRSNLKNDYKNVILDLMPNIIICPEFDSHPDHRATSLLFDEIMGEILHDMAEYRPLVLKKYIHEGVWGGPKDYYSCPMVPTVTKGVRKYAGGIHELDSPCFKWDDRIRFTADSFTTTSLLKNNIIYKAAKQHKLTTAWYEMQRVINGDIVYWERRTDNLLFGAKIQASSGDIRFLSDFKYYDSTDVNDKSEPFKKNEDFCWTPDLNDERKEVIIDFGKKVCFDSLCISEECSVQNHIKELEVIVEDKSFCIEPNNDGSIFKYRFDEIASTDHISLKIHKYIGNPGISEIEIFNGKESNKDLCFLKEYISKKVDGDAVPARSSRRVKILQKLEIIRLKIIFLIKFKCKNELLRILNKK